MFGPVASRRLGRSLGVDIIPAKVCTLDCVYCEVGRTTAKTIDRRPYVPVEAVLAEVEARLGQGVEADFITIAGSGEPTLHSQLGQIIDRIKQVSRTPVALITNGTLFHRQDVRQDAAKADLVIPTLDAADQPTFEAIHRPHCRLTLAGVVEGLEAFRSEYKGPIWLEVFLVADANTSESHIRSLQALIARIKPDKIQLNTAVRPTADPCVRRPSSAQLQTIAIQLGRNCEVIAEDSRQAGLPGSGPGVQDLMAVLSRRPCTLEQLCSDLGVASDQVATHLEVLVQTRRILAEVQAGQVIYRTPPRPW